MSALLLLLSMLAAGPAPGPSSVLSLLAKARESSAAGDIAGSLALLDQAKTQAPNSEDVLFAHAQVALSAHRPVLALFDLEALTRMAPSVSQYHYLLGVSLMQAGDMTSAAHALTRAQELDADRPLTLLALGFALNRSKQFPEARRHLERALLLEPDNLEALAALGEAKEGQGDLRAAEEHATRVLERAPSHATANLVRGLVHMREERWAEAKDALLKAAEAEPLSSKPHYQLSLAYTRLGDEARAREHLAIYQQKVKEVENMVRQLRGHESDGQR